MDNSRQKVSKFASRINANNSRLLVSWSVCLAYASLLTDTFLPAWKFFDFRSRGNGWEKYQEVQSGNSLPKNRGGRRHSTPYIAIRCALTVLTLEYEITVRKTPFRPPPPPVLLNIPRLKHLHDIILIYPLHIFRSKIILV